MVRIFSSALFVATLATSGLALSLSKRDIAKVEADIANINTQVTALDTAIDSFTSTSTLVQALVSGNYPHHMCRLTYRNTCEGHP